MCLVEYGYFVADHFRCDGQPLVFGPRMYGCVVGGRLYLIRGRIRDGRVVAEYIVFDTGDPKRIADLSRALEALQLALGHEHPRRTVGWLIDFVRALVGGEGLVRGVDPVEMLGFVASNLRLAHPVDVLGMVVAKGYGPKRRALGVKAQARASRARAQARRRALLS